jgi:glycosyltransferase involved in cell wall biosynthesis
MNKPIIIFLSTGLSLGGAETQLVNLATRLKKRGWDIQVVSMLPPKAFIEEFDGGGIPLETLNMRRGIPDPRAIFRLVRILYRLRPDIVHSHMVHANLLARITRIFYKLPVLISTAHSINEGGWWRDITYRMTDSLADLTTNVSKLAVERYIRNGVVPKDKIICIPNGIDTSKFKPDRETGKCLRNELRVDDNFVWLAVGRFEATLHSPNY